ncbi:MAG TPA: TrmH family RNA methyltransferase [Polyangiaceae bacterium]|nr:TrmH family RNA methyltransferase [Polyangiaceae bacterium]
MPAKVVRVHSESGDFQVALALRDNRNKRQKQREFFVESVACINALRGSGWQVTTFLYQSEGLSDWARDTLANVEAERHLQLTPELMQKLSARNEPSELVAIVRMPSDDLARIPLRDPLFLVVVDRPKSPGNLGTILRTADAFGVQGVVVTGHAADLFDPQSVRASLGTLFTMPVVRIPSSQTLEPWLSNLKRDHGARLVGTSARAKTLLSENDFSGATVLFLGNETAGLSAHCRSLCDELVGIPQRGNASSLNVASAAAISLYEIDRQRRIRDPRAPE